MGTIAEVVAQEEDSQHSQPRIYSGIAREWLHVPQDDDGQDEESKRRKPQPQLQFIQSQHPLPHNPFLAICDFSRLQSCCGHSNH